MPEIRMSPKHQLTLPAQIVREAKLSIDDKLRDRSPMAYSFYRQGPWLRLPMRLSTLLMQAYAKGFGGRIAPKRWARLFIVCVPSAAI